MGTMWLTEKPRVGWYYIGQMFLAFWHLSKGSSTGHNWISIFDNHKKDFCLLISYLFFLCISISVVVPSGNSSIRLGVEHCISKLQVVEEFDRRNGLNPCRQHEVIFTWFTRYSFLQFAIDWKSVIKSGLQRTLNPWPCDTGAMVQTTELWSYRRWELVICGS